MNKKYTPVIDSILKDGGLDICLYFDFIKTGNNSEFVNNFVLKNIEDLIHLRPELVSALRDKKISNIIDDDR